MMCCVGAMAAIGLTTNMNPFAYNLSAELSADQQTLTIKYCLNANVESLKIVIKGENQPITHDVTESSKLKKTVADKPYFSPYEITIPITDLGAGTYTWRIEVQGKGRDDIEIYSQNGTSALTYPFYLPSSVDIVKDTRSFNYGKVIVVEGSHSGKGNGSYHSNEIGAGLYVYNPDFTPILNRNSKPGFNGGSKTWNSPSNSYFANTGKHPLRRVRVSKDGRIFVTSMHEKSNSYVNGHVLWEVDPNFNRWGTVMGKGINGTTYDYATYQLRTSTNAYIAGPTAGFDVRGEGKELTLLMLSCDKSAFSYINHTYFHLNEYNLGTDTTWSSTPTKTIDISSVFIAPEGSNVQYDSEGGIWCISNRSATSDTYPGWVHISPSGTRDLKKLINNQQNAAIRFNHDFSQVIIGGKSSGTPQHSYSATIYTVGKDNSGNPALTEESTIDMSAVGRHINDFAWDPANNIYAVGAHRQDGTDGVGHVAVYCLPYSESDIFTTSAPEPFTIDCEEGLEYNVTTTVNDHAMGSATGGGSIQSCELTTLTATANDGYRFVNWTVGGNVVSEANPYEFIVTQNVEVTANFAPAVFDVTWWNLFQGGEDIADDNPNYPNTNERLWRLLQVEFNHYYTDLGNTQRSNYTDHTKNNTTYTKNKVQLNVAPFLNVTPNKNFFQSNKLFSWLGQYIDDQTEVDLFGSSNSKTAWTYFPYLFINRTDSAYNWPGDGKKGALVNYAFNGENAATTNTNDITWQSFITYGHHDYWRPVWTEAICDLPKTYNYNQDMPITWNRSIPCPSGSIANVTPSTWYKWNTGKSNQLLAWREGDSITGPIVHQVDHDMALYATYVDRHISEVKDNTDVIRLMQNSGYKNNPHDLTVDRKLQAGMYNTICFPFTVYIDDQTDNGVQHSGLAADHPLKGATVLKLIGKDELYDESGEPVVVLNFEQVNKLEAGKPYLIKLAENQGSITQPINFTGVAYDDLTYINGNHTITTDDGAISFHAMISPGNIPSEAIILVADNRLATITASGPMNGLRGYFTIDDSYLNSVAKAGRLYLSVKKPVTTSIPIAPEAEQQTQPKVRKIMQNGQIYVLRGDKVYTITGNRVK